MSLSRALAEVGFAPERVDVSVAVTADVTDVGWVVSSSAITVRGIVPGIDEALFMERATATMGVCPISKAISDSVEITLEATLDS